MEKRVILIDLDRTLVDEDYQLNDPSVVDAIHDKVADGWQVGITADAPLQTMALRWKDLGMNGPLVVERGAGVWYPEDDAFVVFTNADRIVQKARPEILSSLAKMDDVMLVYGDATNFIRNVHELPNVLNKFLVAMNGLRKFSIGMHIRRIGIDGKLLVDVDLAEKVIERLRDHLPISEYLSDGELDRDYGFFHMSPVDVTKASGTLDAFERCRAIRRVVIGDDITDVIDDPSVEFYTVSNADQKVKAAAKGVSTSPYTKGVRELLESLN